MPPVIKVENLSKMYRLGEVGTGTVRDDLARAWAKFRGKEDPFQKVGQVNRRDEAADGDHEYVWALQDINFEVEQGEILGIIGRNGAGKSTLLKLLSRITSPTTGRIRARGRIASLLEVGTGFHPELSGRENIYLNGALLGMTRREVTKRLEEIVEFSGCAKYIDTPVKRYSSGMMVRLGFSVAAHLECEILIVDEVLAVGDAEFQKRCLGKMSDVASDGRTILFVSHNMAAVKILCPNCALVQDGRLTSIAPSENMIALYLGHNDSNMTTSYYSAEQSSRSLEPKILSAHVHQQGSQDGCFQHDQMVFIDIEVASPTSRPLSLTCRLFNRDGLCVHHAISMANHNYTDSLRYRRLILPPHILAAGQYSVCLTLHEPNIVIHEVLEAIMTFEVTLNDQWTRRMAKARFQGLTSPGIGQWIESNGSIGGGADHARPSLQSNQQPHFDHTEFN